MVYLYAREFEEPVQGSRSLLAQALRDRGLPPMPLLHDEAGRPYLKDGPQISLSHTRGAAALALSDSPVGVDIERLRPIRENIDRRVMSGTEYDWYVSRGAAAADFFVLWTLKESYYKNLGTGLPGFPNETEFCLENGLWRLRGTPHKFFVRQTKLLFLALCCEEQEVCVMEFPES